MQAANFLSRHVHIAAAHVHTPSLIRQMPRAKVGFFTTPLIGATFFFAPSLATHSVTPKNCVTRLGFTDAVRYVG